MKFTKHKTVLLVGSYAGQDSLGDKGLLLSVASQLRRAFGDEVEFVAHVVSTETNFTPAGIKFKQGAWRIIGPCLHAVRLFQFWPSLEYLLAIFLIPAWWVYKKRNRSIWNEFTQDCRECDMLYFYGGTQLSSQWFALNFPPTLLTVLLCKFYRKPVFFGPQQYGPLTASQARLLRWTLRYLVKDFRVRNTSCQRLLRATDEKLTLDEIYSCDINYPILRATARGEYLLVNFRGINFLSDYDPQEICSFCEIIKLVTDKLLLPVKIVQMSGASFCDDTEIANKLLQYGLDVELLPHTHDENDIIESARNAVGVISMSFHGCVLTMLAGRPAVPVSSGDYYHHKYADFDRYTGDQHVPVVSLRNCNPRLESERIFSYLDRFCQESLIRRRNEASRNLRSWYLNIASHLEKPSPHD